MRTGGDAVDTRCGGGRHVHPGVMGDLEKRGLGADWRDRVGESDTHHVRAESES